MSVTVACDFTAVIMFCMVVTKTVNNKQTAKRKYEYKFELKGIKLLDSCRNI